MLEQAQDEWINAAWRFTQNAYNDNITIIYTKIKIRKEKILSIEARKMQSILTQVSL